MKTYRPISVIAAGSSFSVLFVLILLLVIHFVFQELDVLIIVLVPIVTGVFVFLLFYLLVSKYLNARLRLIYRNVLTQKMKSSQLKSAKMTEDVVGKMEVLTEAWAKDRQKELSRLQEQERFRREFLGNISHELKTPIFSIQGYILTLLEGGLEDEAVNRRFLERASKGVDRITHILDDLDTITRLESSQIEIHQTKFSITELANEIIDDLQWSANKKSVQLKKVFQGDIFVKADRGRIAQVFTNLITNSIYYGKEEGETEIRIYKLDNVVSVEISDNGGGIHEEHLPRLFERFYRVDKSRARHEGGTGLGLAIVKHIIDSHDQTIAVRSTVDVGSTFTFTLEKG